LTYFDLDELINDYEVTTVGLVMTELSYQSKVKNDLEEISARSD
jgi:putative hemolysin